MDNNKITTLSLDAELPTAGIIGPTTATLIVRCSSKHNTLEAYVNVGDMVQKSSYNPSFAEVRIKFDGDKPMTKGWRISDDHTAIFVAHEKDFVRTLSVSQTFLFEFRPYQKTDTEIKFDVRGLASHLDKISYCLKQCVPLNPQSQLGIRWDTLDNSKQRTAMKELHGRMQAGEYGSLEQRLVLRASARTSPAHSQGLLGQRVSWGIAHCALLDVCRYDPMIDQRQKKL